MLKFCMLRNTSANLENPPRSVFGEPMRGLPCLIRCIQVICCVFCCCVLCWVLAFDIWMLAYVLVVSLSAVKFDMCLVQITLVWFGLVGGNMGGREEWRKMRGSEGRRDVCKIGERVSCQGCFLRPFAKYSYMKSLLHMLQGFSQLFLHPQCQICRTFAS